MLKCPNGHPNPADQQLCEVCDALIVPPTSPVTPWYRRWWFAASCGAAAALLVAAVAAVVVTQVRPEDRAAPPDEGELIAQWWESGAGEHVEFLHDSLEDAKQNVRQFDKFGLERSCQKIHDASVVDLRAHLPAPDPDLTAELDAAIDDAHALGHMCISAMSGSPNNYDMEFTTNLDQALEHLDAAKDIATKEKS